MPHDGLRRQRGPLVDETGVSEIRVGSSTKANVRAWLGTPGRSVMFADDADDADNHEIWEYRGRDPSGTYKIQIEFDGNGITRRAVKIRR